MLKAGGAYLPLDLDYPAERLAFMLADSRASLLLCDSDLDQRVALGGETPRLELDRLAEEGLDAVPQVTHLPGHLAYLIYTSGSTGLPKGVAVARGPIHRHCRGIIGLYELDSASRELHFMSFAFDGAQERWLSVLLAGGSLVVRDDSLWTPEQTLAALHEHGVTVACFPPAYLQQLAEVAERQGQAPAVQVYCFGGDAVPEASFELVKRALRPRRLVNGYGPTETVVTPLLWRAEASETCDAAYAPIGRGVAGRGLYVLDADLNPLPVGVAGELYLGGECLARGYHQRAGLTAERFVPDPFDGQGGRMYRTGDLVRQREDGLVDYLGRLDLQVKIRGFRIELGEIEARLRASAGVQDAAVVVRESATGKQLAGYVVSAAGAGLERVLKAELQAQLPDYMVPARILVLERFPLSANGKLDRRALPEPEWAAGSYRAPRNALEQALADIWQEVLGVPQVGIDDNFFELGGDSLQVLKVISRVRSRPELGFTLKLRDLMQKPCIAELSGYEPAVQGEAPDPLLALNTRLTEVPALFCLHAGFGTVFDYEPLARRLDGRRTVYGLQCRMLLDPAWQDSSLQAMAEAYAARIRQQQPEGPYHLLGWSLGGALALLVARELEAQGQQVEFAGLVDSYVAGVAEAGDWREDLCDFLVFVLGMAADEAQALIAAHAEGLAEAEGAARVIEAAMDAPRSGEGDHGLLGASELGQIFAVGSRLKALSLGQPSLPSTDVAAHCWWVAGRDDERRVFDGQVRRALDRVVAGGHYELLQRDDLLGELEELLAPQAVTLS
ncbi:Dimodular nonribosomal peptide synthase [compost metagenome]